MAEFDLKIVSPDGVFFDGKAKQISLRSIDGDVAVMAGHIPYLTAVGIGECRVYSGDGQEPRIAACCGGLLNVTKDGVFLAPTTFEWAEDIDLKRAEAAKEKALSRIASPKSETAKKLAQIKLQRAELRIKTAGKADRSQTSEVR